jgi:hypothetical protein
MLRGRLLARDPSARGLVALMVGWPLLADLIAIKRAGVPILRSLNIQYRLKQQALAQRAGMGSFGCWAAGYVSQFQLLIVSQQERYIDLTHMLLGI